MKAYRDNDNSTNYQDLDVNQEDKIWVANLALRRARTRVEAINVIS